MPVSYNKLFHLLLDMGIRKGELQKKANITASIMARLAKNETVKTDTIGKICEALGCQPGDIMEYISIDELLDKKGKQTGYAVTSRPQLYVPEEETENVVTLGELEKDNLL